MICFVPNDFSYLRQGSPRQRDAFDVLESLGLIRDLARYAPTLAGTIPLEIDLSTSDLDVLCYALDLGEFSEVICRLYGDQYRFALRKYPIREVESVIASFRVRSWDVELFAQNLPIESQYGWLHLLAEAHLLEQGGVEAKHAIRELKRQGMKTEPAFAQYFGLTGDPYEVLAQLGRAHLSR